MRIHKSATVGLLLILAVAAGLRFYDLDRASMGSDVMEFYKIAQAGIPPGELLRNGANYIPGVSPVWFAAHNAFLQFFRLKATFGEVRLLDALAGWLTVLAIFGLGSRLGGRAFGLLAAFCLALHPIPIQMSRECYFYAPVMLGCVLMLWGLLILVDR
ncbi:MAG: glycosyltransferase family 39 protein, partial [Kiritimatiellae bacterium]|nr:glycosyltransferase family 39 protein [Kiritimatiellia bacterium]